MRGNMTSATSLALRLSTLVAVGGLLVAAVLVLGGSRDAQASYVDPVVVPGNPSCADLGYDYEKKVEPPDSGTHPLDGHSVTVTRYGEYFDWTATLGMDAVIAKGGTDANVYVYDPPAESFGDTALHAPINPDKNEPYGLSHISFCYDLEPDVEKVSLTVGTPDPATGDCTGPAPTDIDTSQDVPICTRQVIRNNGGAEPVDVADTLTLTAPPGCTIIPSDPVVWNVSLPPGIPESRDDNFAIHCSQASNHVFMFEDEVVITTGGVTDDDPDNNFASAQLSVNVLAEADLKVTNIWVDPWPTDIDVSETFTATIWGTLHNNGPYGPATGTVTFSADVPPDCTADVYLCAAQHNLPVSVATTVGCDVDIHCSQPSSHVFDFDVQISEPKDPHVVDPDPTNNVAWIPETVTAWGYADVKVTGISVTGPAEIDVSETATATVHLTLHNNGGYGLVTVTAPGLNFVAPAGCTAEPLLCARQVELPVSSPVTVDCDVEIHCGEPSSHGFQFEGWVGEPKEPHVVDLNPANNGPMGMSWGVTAIAYADMKVVVQYIANPPSEIALSQDVRIVLEKVIHNNGPWEPVEAFTETIVSVPANCTVHPEVHVQQYQNVPVSVDIPHHEPFTIHCYELGQRTFVFDAEVGLKEPHVRDLVAGNDTGSTTLTLASVAQTDVKITGIGFVNPPTKIPTGQDVDITLRKHIHNNGPRDPVDISIDANAVAPTDCTVTAKSVPTSLSAVPVSVDQVVDEVWTINCTDDWPPLKTFRFDNSIDVATPYVSDSDPLNNSSSKWFTMRDPFYPYWGDDICDGQDNDGDTVVDEDWDLSENGIADCLDPALDTDGDTLTNDVDDDDDDDGWSDAAEGFMRTDPLNACPLDAYHDAFPPDINNDGTVNVLDIMRYRGPIHGVYDQRYDLNVDGTVNVLDLTAYRSVLGFTCTS
jgi:hypothetical protein